jgi:hypothetical protein
VVLLRAVDAVQDVLKRDKLGYTLLIAIVVVMVSGWLVATIEEPGPRAVLLYWLALEVFGLFKEPGRHPAWNSNDSTTGAAASTARSKAASEALIMITSVRADPPGRSKT